MTQEIGRIERFIVSLAEQIMHMITDIVKTVQMSEKNFSDRGKQ